MYFQQTHNPTSGSELRCEYQYVTRERQQGWHNPSEKTTCPACTSLLKGDCRQFELVSFVSGLGPFCGICKSGAAGIYKNSIIIPVFTKSYCTFPVACAMFWNLASHLSQHSQETQTLTSHLQCLQHLSILTFQPLTLASLFSCSFAIFICFLLFLLALIRCSFPFPLLLS